MAIENTSQDLADLLVTKGFDPVYTDERGMDSSQSEAKVFSFDWKASSGKNYGTAVIVLGDENDLEFFFSDNLGRSIERPQDKEEWFGFLEQLSDFATQHRYTFSPKNINQLKHTMTGMAAIKEGLFEGYYGTRKISYMGEQTEARLVIKHNRMLGENDKRYRYVESLFIETADGERFKLPFKNLVGGRAMLEHVRQGGKPYDIRGAHINEMIQEMAVLSRFNRASQHRVFEGVTKQLIEDAQNYYNNLRENLHHISGSRGYRSYFESWTPADINDESALVEDLKTMFVEQTIDARIEAALPTLARIQQRGTAMKEAQIFENWIDNLSEGTWALPDNPEAQEKLNTLMGSELIVGPDATNATELLYDVVGDDQLFDILQDLASKDPRANIWDDSDVQARLAELGIQTPQSTEAEPADVDQDTAPEQGVAEGSYNNAMAGLQKTIDFAKQHGYKIYRSPSGRKMRFVNKQLGHEIRAQVDNDGDSINVNFMDYSSGTSGNDDASYFDQTFKREYEQALKMHQYRSDYDDDDDDEGPYTLKQLRQLEKQKQGMAEADKNPHTSKLGQALYRDLSKEKKASPQQVQRNKERWAQRQAVREQGVAEGIAEALAQGNYNVGLEDIGKRVILNGKTGDPGGYVLIGIKYTPGGLQAEIVNRNLYTTGYYDLNDISKSKDQTLGEEGVAEGYDIDEFGDDYYMDLIQDMIDRNRRNMSPSRKDRVFAAVKRDIESNGGIFDTNKFNDAYKRIIDFSRDMYEQGVAEGSELAAMLRHAGVKVAEGVLTDSTGHTMDHILKRFSREVADFEKGGDLDNDLYHALYDYYFDDMPYGTKKARDGDPYEWVTQRLADELGVNESNSGMIMPEAMPMDTFEMGKTGPAMGGGMVAVEGSGCNMTTEGEYCPEHGLAECAMEEDVPGALGGGGLGAVLGTAVAGPAGTAPGAAIGAGMGSLVKEKQLDEIAPLVGAGLAAGARALLPLLSRIGPSLSRMASGAGKAAAPIAQKGAQAAAQTAGQATRAGAEIAAKNAVPIGIGAGAYSAITDLANQTAGGVGTVYNDVKSAAAAIGDKLGNAVDNNTVLELAAAAVKYALPIGIVIALLYGGKKLIDRVMNETKDDAINYNGAITGSYYESKDDPLARIKSLAFVK